MWQKSLFLFGELLFYELSELGMGIAQLHHLRQGKLLKHMMGVGLIFLAEVHS